MSLIALRESVLNDKGLLGFLGGNLTKKLEIKFGKEHQTINFNEIVSNWLLAKEIIMQSKRDLNLEVMDVTTEDLNLISTEGNIKVDGGVVDNFSYNTSRVYPLKIK